MVKIEDTLKVLGPDAKFDDEFRNWFHFFEWCGILVTEDGYFTNY